MARPFWKGVISFGLVIIPVKMYVATQSRNISFHLLHKKCLTRPKQVLHCELDNEYFTSKDTVRGYEYAKDQYVVFTEEDFEKVPVKTSHKIDISGFVSAEEIDAIYYRDSHYLEPEELGAKPFNLLKEVLAKTKLVGVAKVTFAKREHLCTVKPLDDILELNTMYYHNEIKSHKELTPRKPELTDSELEMATSLVKAMSTTFKPEKYKDDYYEALKYVIEAKVKGGEIKVPEEPRVEVPDLMAALKASIEATKKKRPQKELVRA